MTDAKKPKKEPHAKQHLRGKDLAHEPSGQPLAPSDPGRTEPSESARKRAIDFLIATAAHAFVLAALAIASVIWVYFTTNPSVPPWAFILLVLLLIFISYMVLIAVQYFFEADFVIARRWDLHVILIAIFMMSVSVPLAMMQSYTNSRTSELMAQKQALEEEAKRAKGTLETADSKRFSLYDGVTKSLRQILQKGEMDTEKLNDILHYCVDSIAINNPKVVPGEVRTTVVFVAKGEKYLVVPKHGYFGKTLHQDITHLYFDVSPQNATEDKEKYLARLGVAGWCFVNGSPILDDDVQQAGKDYRYKVYEDEPDRAMICALIPDLAGTDKTRYIGVLSVSSLSAGVFTRNDQALMQFFATLLGRFPTPLEIPSFILDGNGKK